jgi:hypothetical protein
MDSAPRPRLRARFGDGRLVPTTAGGGIALRREGSARSRGRRTLPLATLLASDIGILIGDANPVD